MNLPLLLKILGGLTPITTPDPNGSYSTIGMQAMALKQSLELLVKANPQDVDAINALIQQSMV